MLGVSDHDELGATRRQMLSDALLHGRVEGDAWLIEDNNRGIRYVERCSEDQCFPRSRSSELDRYLADRRAGLGLDSVDADEHTRQDIGASVEGVVG